MASWEPEGFTSAKAQMRFKVKPHSHQYHNCTCTHTALDRTKECNDQNPLGPGIIKGSRLSPRSCLVGPAFSPLLRLPDAHGMRKILKNPGRDSDT